MDEPTTHLDMASIDALIGAMEAFTGTLIFISHDVHFIRKLATSVLHISAGKLTPYAGDYQYYLDKSFQTSDRAALVSGTNLTDARAGTAVPVVNAEPVKLFKTREEKKAENQRREAALTAKRELKKSIAAMETQIAALEKKQAELALDLEHPSTYDKPAKAMQLNRELLGVQESITRTSAAWEKALEELAVMESAPRGMES